MAAGLVERSAITVAEGTARRRLLWRLNHRSAMWPDLAAVLASVAVPRRTTTKASRVPERLAHLFWNASLSEVDVDRDAVYIARRILDSDDLDALAWGARHLPTAAWAEVSSQRGLAANRRALARNLASSPIAA